MPGNHANVLLVMDSDLGNLGDGVKIDVVMSHVEKFCLSEVKKKNPETSKLQL